MWVMKAENKMSALRDRIKLQEGFTLIELAIATLIIGIVVAVAVPQYSQFKNRANDAVTQSHLHKVFQACQEFWTFNSSNNPCLLTTVSNKEYGFIPSAAVKVTIESNVKNTEYDFSATASHTSSSNIFVIDYRGVVSEVGGGDGQNDGNDEDDGGNKGGNNGQGCSEEAHNGGQNLGKNAAGGCGTAPSKP